MYRHPSCHRPGIAQRARNRCTHSTPRRQSNRWCFRCRRCHYGPLASKDQQQDVTDATQRLIDAGGQVRLGGPDAVANFDAAGAFFPPTILEFDDADTDAVHTIEAFGSVTLVMGYDGSVAEAVRLAARGSGSLVATVCSNDDSFVAETTLGIAS